MIQALIRSQGQIFFQRATLSGLLVLLALALASPWLAGFALLGAAVQTALSVILRRSGRSSTAQAPPGDAQSHEGRSGTVPAPPTGGSHRASALAMSSLSTDATARRDAADGLHGFCGALTGCAGFLACGSSFAALIWTVLGGALCALLVRFFERLRIFDWLPMLTGPFCAVNTVLNPVFGAWHLSTPAVPQYGPLSDLVTGTIRASAQVLLTDQLLTGLLVFGIVLLAGLREGLWSLAGALSTTALGFWILGGEPATAGLAGYCGFLTALALGAVFPRKDAPRVVRMLVPLVGSCLTVPVLWALQHTGMAIYTWPFVLTTWAALFVQRQRTRREVAGAAS